MTGLVYKDEKERSHILASAPFVYARIKTRVQPLCIRVSLSKNLVEFRRRSGEKKSNHFLR